MSSISRSQIRVALAIEAIVARRVGAIAVRQVSTWSSSAHTPEDSIEHLPVTLGSNAQAIARKKWLDHTPLEVVEAAAHDSAALDGKLESRFSTTEPAAEQVLEFGS